MPRLETPQSSNVNAIDYDPDTGAMTVEFRSGTYRYSDVRSEHFENLIKLHQAGGSIGGYVHRNIKQHGFEKLSGQPIHPEGRHSDQ